MPVSAAIHHVRNDAHAHRTEPTRHQIEWHKCAGIDVVHIITITHGIVCVWSAEYKKNNKK